MPGWKRRWKELMNDISLLKEICIRFPGCKPEGCLRLGLGLSQKVGEIMSGIAKGKILLITDKTIVSLGLHNTVVASLEEAGFQYDIFDNVLPEPHIETMLQIEEMLYGNAYAAVIGLGGGSALDVAKLAAVMAYMKRSAKQIFDSPGEINGSLPTVLMPTTSGTGSEVSPYSVMADGNKKRFIGSEYLYATVALVDPLLTATMPPRVTAATGLDALTHGVEGAIGKDNPYTRAMMLQCVKLVFKYLPRAVEKGDDIEARYYMSLASVMGMLAYTQGGGLYAHSMSYILTTDLGTPHGLGCGLSLPYTLRLNQPQISDLLGDMGTVISESGRIVEENEVVTAFLELVRRVGIPTNLSALGIKKEALDEMAHRLVEEYFRALNPVKLEVNDALVLMQAMFEENILF